MKFEIYSKLIKNKTSNFFTSELSFLDLNHYRKPRQWPRILGWLYANIRPNKKVSFNIA